MAHSANASRGCRGKILSFHTARRSPCLHARSPGQSRQFRRRNWRPESWLPPAFGPSRPTWWLSPRWSSVVCSSSPWPSALPSWRQASGDLRQSWATPASAAPAYGETSTGLPQTRRAAGASLGRVSTLNYGVDRCAHGICDILRILVLPVPEHRPPGLLKAMACVHVTRYVTGGLQVPVVRVRRETARAVLRAAVPETTIEKDCDPLAREDNVCSTTKALHGSDVYPVSKASSVKSPTDGQFQGCVSRAVRLHVAASSGRRRPGLGGTHRVKRATRASVSPHHSRYRHQRRGSQTCRRLSRNHTTAWVTS